MIFRRGRFGRLHTLDPAPTFEGVLLGRWNGHYHLINASLKQGDQSIQMDGRVEVPADHVICFQELK